MRKTKAFIWLFPLLLALLGQSIGAAQTELRPEVSDPQDRMVQQLCVMSQRDKAFEGLLYNGGFLTARGCQPVCITNGVIAALDVQDRETAVNLVKEIAQVLVFEGARGTGRMELDRIETLFSREDRKAQAEDYPQLAEVIGDYEGEIMVLSDQPDAQVVSGYFGKRQTGVLVGRMTVSPSWEALVDMMQRLHEMGMDDVRICLASVGAGKASSDTPLGLGQNGHYLTLMLHVGTFVKQGRIYVLDSLPRALRGEESGYTRVLRRPYPFAEQRREFSRTFNAERISETVIRLAFANEAAWENASIREKARMLAPLILYGPGVLMISAN